MMLNSVNHDDGCTSTLGIIEKPLEWSSGTNYNDAFQISLTLNSSKILMIINEWKHVMTKVKFQDQCTNSKKQQVSERISKYGQNSQCVFSNTFFLELHFSFDWFRLVSLISSQSDNALIMRQDFASTMEPNPEFLDESRMKQILI